MTWPFRFCPGCGHPLDPTTLSPIWCPSCGSRHDRPIWVGVACVLVERNAILLGQRRSGRWCIPCGYLEWGEPVEEGARREMREETGIEVEVISIRSVQTNFHRSDESSVGVWFDARRIGGELRAGDDLLDAQFFPLSSLPAIEFPSDEVVLRSLRS